MTFVTIFRIVKLKMKHVKPSVIC